MSGVRQVSRAGPGIHARGGELPHSLGHSDRILIAGDDLCARLTEGERDGVADLPRPADSRDQHDPSSKVMRVRAHCPPTGAGGLPRKASSRSSHSSGTS